MVIFAFCFAYGFAQVGGKIAENVDISKVRSIEELTVVLKSSSAKERLDAIKTLWSVESDTVTKIICEHYFNEKDMYIKTQIVEYAAYKKDVKWCADIFLDAISSDNNSLRNSAWLSVNEDLTKDDRVKVKLKEAVKSEKNKWVKMNALRKISVVAKSTETVKILSSTITDDNEDEDVRIAAVDVIKRIRNEDAKKEIERIKRMNIKNRKISDAIKDAESKKTDVKGELKKQ
jgi:hypothetical protein